MSVSAHAADFQYIAGTLYTLLLLSAYQIPNPKQSSSDNVDIVVRNGHIVY